MFPRNKHRVGLAREDALAPQQCQALTQDARNHPEIQKRARNNKRHVEVTSAEAGEQSAKNGCLLTNPSLTVISHH